MARRKKNATEAGVIVALDGPVGAGKSTAARLLADRMGYLYLDSGAMYRAIAWKALEQGVDPKDASAIARICRETVLEITWGGRGQQVWVDGLDVTEKVRTPEISRLASAVSQLRCVRDVLGELQRTIGWREARERGGVVMEGRDIGTVVFPDASFKFYLDADIRDRGRRRWEELHARGIPADYEETLRELRERDRNDTTRELAPLRKAEDAYLVDTTGLTPEAVVERMVEIIRSDS
jgi:cytidylate kinase